ncbi:MAG TPA: hypothetical protein VK509_08030, partial [Polyangiales bacterium]|nr:hypothetical protein [Polyangiales bacterium]
SFGFGSVGTPDAKPLLARWTVGGVPLVGDTGTVEVPTTDGIFTVFFEQPTTSELLVWSRGGERYRADVTVAVSEADGSGTVLCNSARARCSRVFIAACVRPSVALVCSPVRVVPVAAHAQPEAVDPVVVEPDQRRERRVVAADRCG